MQCCDGGLQAELGFQRRHGPAEVTAASGEGRDTARPGLQAQASHPATPTLALTTPSSMAESSPSWGQGQEGSLGCTGLADELREVSAKRISRKQPLAQQAWPRRHRATKEGAGGWVQTQPLGSGCAGPRAALWHPTLGHRVTSALGPVSWFINQGRGSSSDLGPRRPGETGHRLGVSARRGLTSPS